MNNKIQIDNKQVTYDLPKYSCVDERVGQAKIKETFNKKGPTKYLVLTSAPKVKL